LKNGDASAKCRLAKNAGDRWRDRRDNHAASTILEINFQKLLSNSPGMAVDQALHGRVRKGHPNSNVEPSFKPHARLKLFAIRESGTIVAYRSLQMEEIVRKLAETTLFLPATPVRPLIFPTDFQPGVRGSPGWKQMGGFAHSPK
jgi:hypothetical protein